MNPTLFRSSVSFSNSKYLAENNLRGVAIGNFDGFHLGHQKLIEELFQCREGEKTNQTFTPGLLSFYPHPKIYFKKKSQKKLATENKLLPLFSIRQKLSLAGLYNLDFMILEKFNPKLLELSPDDFIKTYLSDLLKVDYVVVGDDFRFGRDREGDIKTLSDLSHKYTFKLKVVESVNQDKSRVSTGRVKSVLGNGEVKKAAKLLGRDYYTSGFIQKGDGRGTSLTGFPTLNILPKNIFKIKKAVYLTQIEISGELYPSITNVGYRPTLCGKSFVIETFVLDKKLKNLRGRRAKLTFLKFVRDEKKFNDLEELKEAISRDVDYAVSYFANRKKQKIEFYADEFLEEDSVRLDLLITNFLDSGQGQKLGLSRNKVSSLIKNGNVLVNGKASLKPSFKISEHSKINLDVHVQEESFIEPDYDTPLDIVYEDEDVLVINKQASLVVHPGSGHKNATLVNALVSRMPSEFKTVGSALRPGIVHRLDKGTSGLMVVAKNEFSYQILQKQFLPTRTIKRKYKAVIRKTPKNWLENQSGSINQPIARDSRNRKKFTVSSNGKNSVTNWRIHQSFDKVSILELALETGRTHQIRVHLAHEGAPICGDPLYGEPYSAFSKEVQNFLKKFNRQALHATSLEFVHPVSKEILKFESELPKEINELINILNS